MLTEPVDPAQIAVPDGWQSVPTDSDTLSTALRALEQGHPSLISVLRAEEMSAAQSGTRLFAYTPTRPLTFVSIVSYASPGTPLIDPRHADNYPAQLSRTRSFVVEAHVVQLPAGGALQARTVVSTRTVRVAAQDDVVRITNRTVELHMVTEAAAFPSVFSEIENSLRAG